MKIEAGATAWTSSRLGVIPVTVIEIESVLQSQILVRDKTGKRHVRDAQDLHDTEAGALRARLDKEAFWAGQYRDMALACEENASRIRQRLLRIETHRKGKVA